MSGEINVVMLRTDLIPNYCASNIQFCRLCFIKTVLHPFVFLRTATLTHQLIGYLKTPGHENCVSFTFVIDSLDIDMIIDCALGNE